MRALTETLQGVMRLARLEGSPETPPPPVLCRWRWLRRPWGFTAPLQMPQTTTMKGSVSGRMPYSPISLLGIRMTWPRLLELAGFSSGAAEMGGVSFSGGDFFKDFVCKWVGWMYAERERCIFLKVF